MCRSQLQVQPQSVPRPCVSYCSSCTHAELCIQREVSNEQRVLQGVRVSSTQIDRTRVVSDSYVKQFAQVLNGGGKTMQLIIAFNFDAHYAVFHVKAYTRTCLRIVSAPRVMQHAACSCTWCEDLVRQTASFMCSRPNWHFMRTRRMSTTCAKHN